MAKWKVTGLLWSNSEERYQQPGEIIEIPDDVAEILLEKQVITPAVYQVDKKTSNEVKHGASISSD